MTWLETLVVTGLALLGRIAGKLPGREQVLGACRNYRTRSQNKQQLNKANYSFHFNGIIEQVKT